MKKIFTFVLLCNLSSLSFAARIFQPSGTTIVNGGSSGSTTTPGSPTGSVQFNNSSAFGGSVNFLFDATNGSTTLKGTLQSGQSLIRSTSTFTDYFQKIENAPFAPGYLLTGQTNRGSSGNQDIATIFNSENYNSGGFGDPSGSYFIIASTSALPTSLAGATLIPKAIVEMYPGAYDAGGGIIDPFIKVGTQGTFTSYLKVVPNEVSVVGSSFTIVNGTISINGTTYRWNAGKGSAGQVLTSDGATIPNLTFTTPSGAGDALLAATQTWTGGNTHQSWDIFNGSGTFNLKVLMSSLTVSGAITSTTSATISAFETPIAYKLSGTTRLTLSEDSTNTTFQIGAGNNFIFIGPANTSAVSTGLIQFKNLSTFSTNSAGQSVFMAVTPTINSNTTGGNTDFLINRTQTTVGSGSQLLLDAQVTNVSKFSIDNTGLTTAAGGFVSTANNFFATINNTSSANNARIQLTASGLVASRNVADTNPALIVNQINAGSTGNILTLQFAGVDKATFSVAGNLGLAGSITASSVTLLSPGTDSNNVPTLVSTGTLTNKRITRRDNTVAQSATPAINTDTTDHAHITALAQAITSMTTNLTGTPVAGDTLWIDITDDGTTRAITWGASFEASGTVALPTTTVISTRLDVGFVWNEVTSKWRCIASS